MTSSVREVRKWAQHWVVWNRTVLTCESFLKRATVDKQLSTSHAPDDCRGKL